jgi:hypothetical protein
MSNQPSQSPRELVEQLKAQGLTFEQIVAELKKRGIKLGGQK